MEFEPSFRRDRAVMGDGSYRYVVVGPDQHLHREASEWLGFLHDIGRSPNTIRDYGSRVAWYLSWTALTTDWRAIDVPHLAMWKRTVANAPVRKSNGREVLRSEATVGLWMVPVRSFYEWAEARAMLSTNVAARMTQVKYFAPGTAAGGEFGATRRVLIEELRPDPGADESAEPEWIDDPGARERLELLELNVRDRLIVDLLYFTGIRVGEALSLFTQDMHLGGGSATLGCRLVDPHFHVVLNNPVENEARSKGCARVLHVSDHLVERYIDYVLERQRLLGDRDVSPHTFVNLYTRGDRLGAAMTYQGIKGLMDRVGKRIGWDLTGPHVLRHTLATRLLRGIDCEPQPLDVVGDIMGHRSTSSTLIYTHDRERLKQKALASISPRTVALRGLS